MWFHILSENSFKSLNLFIPVLKLCLLQANTPEARSKRPWIIVFGHRPMYCSNNDDDDCTKNESRTRYGSKPKIFEDFSGKCYLNFFLPYIQYLSFQTNDKP